MPEEQKPEGAQGESPAPSQPPAAPAAAAPPPKPAAPAAKPAPAPPPPPPVWEGELPAALQAAFGEKVSEFIAWQGQPSFTAASGSELELVTCLRDQHGFDYLVDITATHWPAREMPFDVIYILYSFALNQRIRMKIRVGDPLKGEAHRPHSLTGLYPTANWLEREVYDMFGVEFAGHPDLRRILMPEDWSGYPLRKDYGILNMDNRWVQENLGIESGQ